MRSMFGHIVVGYSASVAAHAALQVALVLSAFGQTRLTVVAVAREPVARDKTLQPYVTPIEREHERCQAWLAAAAVYAAEADCTLTTQLWTGSVAGALAAAASTLHADLIIVGASGYRPWRRRVGAVLVRRSPCPVLAVPGARRLPMGDSVEARS